MFSMGLVILFLKKGQRQNGKNLALFKFTVIKFSY